LTGVAFSVCFYDLPPAELVAAAVTAEELGFDLCWLGEHLFLPASYASVHPTRDEGSERAAPIVGHDTELLDLWVIAGAVATSTTRLRFGTGIYLAGLRHPLLSARSAATASALSGGRLVVGLGAGWLQEEFDVLQVPFDSRGSRLDEAIVIMRRGLEGGLFEHAGTHWQFPAVQVTPTPLSVPLVVGGNSPPALRRAARLGDGWFNSGAAGLEELTVARQRIEAGRAEAGRSRLPFTYWVRPPQLTPDLSDRLAAEGFTNQVVWGHQLWPGAAGVSLAAKQRAMRAAAAEFGLA
jgi:probable F420-dependent oxidoreductase